MYKVKFADIGEGLTEGKVLEIFVKVGDLVQDGDPLFSVETDKVNSDIPAPTSGKISQILIQPDQEIKVGDVVLEIETAATKSAPTKPTKKDAGPQKEENASVVGSTPVSDEVISRVLPTTKKLDQNTNSIKATPLARKMAADLKVDLNQIKPTGPGGRILVHDLEQKSGSGAATKPQTKTESVQQINQPTFVNSDQPLTFESRPMNGIRKATVQSMSRSHQVVADFTGFSSFDVSALVNLRAQLKPLAEVQGIKLTYLAFIVKATAKALQDMPQINVQIDEANKAIKYFKNLNLGVAVDTPEGLMVPVIKAVDQLSIFEIAIAINDLAIKAKNKKLTMKDVTGATMTITNFGSVGLDYATPIINSPEAAILGVGMMRKTPVYVDDVLQAQMLMPFSMTADHRIIDGADVGRFLQRLAYYLQNPAVLLV